MQKDELRKRKTHTKSRKGCGNCKLRRVKCDEGKPQCVKCVQYGVQCSYESNGKTTGFDGEGTLQLPGEGSFTFASEPPAAHGPMLPRDSLSPEDTPDDLKLIESMLGMELELHESQERYHMTAEDVAVLKRFHYRTIYTIGTAHTVGIYRQQMVRLAAMNSSCLTHVVLALTLMHDRYLDSPWTTPPSSKEAFHNYHGTAIFNSKLYRPIDPADRDPLWGTAAMLGCITIASIDATTPEEAWPLKPASVTDLDWLRMSDGKKEVWRLVNPLREDSVFREALSSDHSRDPEPYAHPVPELQMLYPYLTKLYSFDPSTPEEEAAAQDPYHTAASILVRLLELECNHSTIMYFLSFLGHMDPRFRELLHRKDARALLLLSWWYGKMSQYSVWWQTRRMRLEGQAICLYLEKYHGNQEELIKLLDYPRLMTGLDRR